MTELEKLYRDIRLEIERLVGEGVDRDAALMQALATVLKRNVYGQTADDYETQLKTIIERLSSETRQPVPTKSICAEVGADYFATYYHLRKMERRGQLTRVKGRYSGWRVA